MPIKGKKMEMRGRARCKKLAEAVRSGDPDALDESLTEEQRRGMEKDYEEIDARAQWAARQRENGQFPADRPIFTGINGQGSPSRAARNGAPRNGH